MGRNTEALTPELIVDEGASPEMATGLKQLEDMIQQNPSFAQQIITLYGKDTDIGKAWIDLLKDDTREESYPSRLVRTLGQFGTRGAMRYVKYDQTTESTISTDETIKDLLKDSRTGNEEHRIGNSRKIGLRRLAIFSGRLAAQQSINGHSTENLQTNATSA